MQPTAKPLFEGCATALITPMKNHDIDKYAFDQLLHNQLQAGIHGLVVTGTTGESPTLTDKEKQYLYTHTKKVAEAYGGHVPIIAGTGSNNTARAIEISRMAEACGADGLLVVTPYYNKASQEGLYAHFIAIAEAVSIPIILYHVPSRTGCSLTVDTCHKLSKHPRMVGLKDATGNIGFSARVAAVCGASLPLYAGNDDCTLPLLSLGGLGVISVVSNLLPDIMCRMYQSWVTGDICQSTLIQKQILPLCDALFSEVNPIPIKAAMALCGMCQEEVRLPLSTAPKTLKQTLSELLHSYGLMTKI